MMRERVAGDPSPRTLRTGEVLQLAACTGSELAANAPRRGATHHPATGGTTDARPAP